MNWISIKDRYPHLMQKVLVTGPDWGWRYKVAIVGHVGNQKIWLDAWSQLDQDQHWKNVITHWMPLPNPPENLTCVVADSPDGFSRISRLCPNCNQYHTGLFCHETASS